jgi:hypothetical protein
MSFQYRILCTIHSYQYEWADTEPTTCPIDPEDPINSDATCIVNQLRPAGQFAPNITSVSLSQPIRVGDIYFDSINMGTLSRIGIFSYCDVGVTSYTIEIYDNTNLQSLGSATFSNTNDYTLNIIDNINVSDTAPVMIEIFVSVNSTISGKNAYISRMILYTY